ncbi:Uncharacterised protein [Mycobacteroides abscessus subsp. abscessus]|nr:hypothetical protein [Mycobacteroides abscessus]SIM09085.1 Uncharacterised protein [Mycobacteroides abscessus subsp. abscessus]
MSESADNEKNALLALGALLGAGAVLYGFFKAKEQAEKGQGEEKDKAD